MEEVLHLEISGQFNGRDATLTIGFDAESAFEIEDVDATNSLEDADEGDESDDTQAPSSEPETPAVEADVEPAVEPTKSTEPAAEPVNTADEVTAEETGDEDEPTGLDQLFPQNQYDPEDLPAFSADTKQFKVTKAVHDRNGKWVPVREITDTLQEKEGEDEWDDNRVTSHLYSVKGKEILERQKDESTGKYEYRVTDLGRAAIKQAMSRSDDFDVRKDRSQPA